MDEISRLRQFFAQLNARACQASEGRTQRTLDEVVRQYLAYVSERACRAYVTRDELARAGRSDLAYQAKLEAHTWDRAAQALRDLLEGRPISGDRDYDSGRS